MVRISLRSKPKKIAGIPIAILILIALAVGVAATGYYISLTYATYNIDANSAFFVMNGSQQVTSLQGFGGDTFTMNYSLFNQANRQLNYHLIINCSDVSEGDTQLRIDSTESTSGRVETGNVQVGPRQMRYGEMAVQFNQSFQGHGRCDFMVTQGDFEWQ